MRHRRPYPPVEELRQKLRYENGQLYWREPHPRRPDIDTSKPVRHSARVLGSPSSTNDVRPKLGSRTAL